MLWTLGLALVSGSFAQAVQRDTASVLVAQIRDSASEWEHRVVRIQGLVDRYLADAGQPSTDAPKFFYLRDRAGDAVLVRTRHGLPDLNQPYQLEGVIASGSQGQTYLDELSRDPWRTSKPAPGASDTAAGPVPSENRPGRQFLGWSLLLAGTTLIIVTHDPEIGEQTERIINILDGKVAELVK